MENTEWSLVFVSVKAVNDTLGTEIYVKNASLQTRYFCSTCLLFTQLLPYLNEEGYPIFLNSDVAPSKNRILNRFLS